MSDPQISVVMPVFNGEQYLKESIESILNQTFTDFEFIIVDDQSTDSSWQIIQDCAARDSRIIAVKNNGKKGCFSARNCGHRLAKGKYLAVMDSDDIALPERFMTQFDFMEQNPDIDVCGSWAQNFGERDDVIKTYQTHEEIRDATFFYSPMNHPSVIFRNNNSILYSENFTSAQDYELWRREIDNLNFANIPEVLLLYRRHSAQTNGKKQNDIANDIRLKNVKKIEIDLSEEEKSIYLGIVNGIFIAKNKRELISAVKMLDNISTAGTAHGYKQLFQDAIRNFIKNAMEHGLQNKVASFKLYFTTFRKWKIFETPRANLRYIYYCFRNLLHL